MGIWGGGERGVGSRQGMREMDREMEREEYVEGERRGRWRDEERGVSGRKGVEKTGREGEQDGEGWGLSPALFPACFPCSLLDIDLIMPIMKTAVIMDTAGSCMFAPLNGTGDR